MVVLATAVLLTVALAVIFRFSKRAMEREALQKAEQTLESTVKHIDNILLGVEQTAGNIYWDLLAHLHQPERLYDYSRKTVEANSYITGCAIALQPYFYKERGKHFMAYYYKADSDASLTTDTHLIRSETFGSSPYDEQLWYTKPVETGKACWMNPVEDNNGEMIATFSLPIYSQQGKAVGVMGVDVSLPRLTKIIHAAKPSPNSFSLMLSSDGSYIVYPDTDKAQRQDMLPLKERLADEATGEVVRKMMKGESGHQSVCLGGTDCYVFYKPFKSSAVPGRVMNDQGWSVAIVYPEADIFGDFQRMAWITLAVAIVGLLLLFCLCHAFTHRRLLPLRLLSNSVQRIAEGRYDEVVPDSRQEDEVGRLQNHFQQMQQALAVNIGELERLNAVLRERGDVLAEAYSQAKEAEEMKMAVLHNMTNQLIAPVERIAKRVDELSQNTRSLDSQTFNQLADDIQQEGGVVAGLLNTLLSDSQADMNQRRMEK